MTREAVADPRTARARARGGATGPTAGWAPGHAQANLIAVPADWAYDVLLFRTRNPRPCPVLDVTDPGSWRTALAPDADLRTRAIRPGSASGTCPGPTSGIRWSPSRGTCRCSGACGVTPQAAVAASRPPFAITHAPGRMLVTDVRDAEYRVGA